MTELHYQDVTIKAKVHDVVRLRERLQLIGFVLLGEDEQTDVYYATDRGKLKWRSGKIENVITHYERKSLEGIEQTVVYRYDLNPSPQAVAVLNRESVVIGTLTKQRAIYHKGIHKIHVDCVDGDWFVEIESIDRDKRYSLHALKQHCWEIKDQLDIVDSQLIPTGYFNF